MYERSSIEKWLATGNLICPVTMLKVHDDSIVSNHTLCHLINKWLKSEFNVDSIRLLQVTFGTSPQKCRDFQEKLRVVEMQGRLDLYIHDYMARNNMHASAENFAREAGVALNDVEINPPEGFLTDWWSLFWNMYTNRVEAPRRHETLEASSSKETTRNVNPTMLRPDFRHVLNICPEVQRSDPNILQDVGPRTTPRPDMINLLHGISPEMNQNALLKRASPRMNQDEFGHFPISQGFNMNHGQPMPNFVSGKVCKQEFPRLPALNSMSNSQLPNIAQLAQMLPSSSNFSPLQQQISKKHQLEVNRVDGAGASAKKYIIIEPSNGTPEPKVEHSDIGLSIFWFDIIGNVQGIHFYGTEDHALLHNLWYESKDSVSLMANNRVDGTLPNNDNRSAEASQRHAFDDAFNTMVTFLWSPCRRTSMTGKDDTVVITDDALIQQNATLMIEQESELDTLDSLVTSLVLPIKGFDDEPYGIPPRAWWLEKQLPGEGSAIYRRDLV
ncbi:unnamed protein product [Fraxinus pennsylvanica]|uniref:U-box domain-containing protein n=1 Tax=Fraxinus pennsylvanica TaxID=56036 RepID=A0AAD2A294_9LAMI|nr:unnamed protein product [Fraxinus pennsylvanica]